MISYLIQCALISLYILSAYIIYYLILSTNSIFITTMFITNAITNAVTNAITIHNTNMWLINAADN